MQDILLVTNAWKKLETSGHAPSSRTAHAAASVGKKIFIHGGMSSVGSTLDDVYSLDTGWYKWHFYKSFTCGILAGDQD